MFSSGREDSNSLLKVLRNGRPCAARPATTRSDRHRWPTDARRHRFISVRHRAVNLAVNLEEVRFLSDTMQGRVFQAVVCGAEPVYERTGAY